MLINSKQENLKNK